MTDREGRGRSYPLAPAICTLRPSEARELAFELLGAAELAERIGDRQ